MLIDFPSDDLFRCCENPEVVCADGIVLSVENYRIKEKNFTTPWKSSEPSKRRSTSRINRNSWTIPNSRVGETKLKDLVHQYASKSGGISKQCLRELNRRAPGVFVELMMAVASPVCLEGTQKYQSPPLLRDFFMSLCKDISPAIGIFPKPIWQSTNSFLESKRLHDRNYLQLASLHSHLLSNVLNYMLLHKALAPVLDLCFKMLREIYSIAVDSVHERWDRGNVIPLESTSALDSHNARKEFEETGFFFPGRPLHSMTTNCILKGESGPACNKDYKEAGKYGAGMLLFWCGTHRECIGWILLQGSESLEVIYGTLVTRFSIIPKYVIYDNGCNLYEYCANRAPHLFADTVFLSDGFHWANHRTCSTCFNSSVVAVIEGISSVTHEQKNSYLANFKAISIFMRLDSFTQIMHYVLHNMNYRERISSSKRKRV